MTRKWESDSPGPEGRPLKALVTLRECGGHGRCGSKHWPAIEGLRKFDHCEAHRHESGGYIVRADGGLRQSDLAAVSGRGRVPADRGPRWLSVCTLLGT